MPEIKPEELSTTNILKPAKLNLKVGDTITCKILGGHKYGGAQHLPSIEVEAGPYRGNFPLNRTHLTMLANTLGWNSDNWVGATFVAVVVPQNNPQTKSQVLSWSIKQDSIQPPQKIGA